MIFLQSVAALVQLLHHQAVFFVQPSSSSSCTLLFPRLLGLQQVESITKIKLTINEVESERSFESKWTVFWGKAAKKVLLNILPDSYQHRFVLGLFLLLFLAGLEIMLMDQALIQ